MTISQPQPRTIKIAIVEDKASFRRGLQAIFDLTPGIEYVCMCGSAEEALVSIPKAGADLVLMDLNLPGLSGIECTRQLKRLCPSLPVVMLTIEEDSERVFAALRAGATGYLLKASTPVEIIEGIELVARGGSPMSAIVARRVVESFHGAAEPSSQSQALSKRETEVLEQIALGKRIKQVAGELGVSDTTIQTYLRRIYEKLQVHSQAQAVARFLR
jgi:DNA-binding NarL/FixJ family response regulator